MAYVPLDALNDSVDVSFPCVHPNRLVLPLRFHPSSSEGLSRVKHYPSAPRARQRRQLFYGEVCLHVPTHLPTGAHPIMPQSWEIGTLAEALTEAKWPRLSVFQSGSLPPPVILPWWENAHDVLAIAET